VLLLALSPTPHLLAKAQLVSTAHTTEAAVQTGQGSHKEARTDKEDWRDLCKMGRAICGEPTSATLGC
jgi:hypothetical protein